jgi:hypothetical protein
LTAAGTTATSALTGIAESGITDGSVLARVGATESITAAWTFSGTPSIANASPILNFAESGVAADNGKWRLVGDGTQFGVQALNDAENVAVSALLFSRSGTTVTTAALTATNITLTGAVSVTGTSTLGVVNAGAVTGTSLTASTGNLTVTSGNIVLSGTAPTVSNGNGEGIQTSNSANTLSLFANSSTLSFTGGTFVPTGGGIQLGSTVDRWSIIYLTSAPDVSSDRNLKQDIATSDLGIEFIDALKPVSYRLVADPATRRYGFIAQDLQALGFPAVSVGKDGRLGLRYEELIAPTVRALQEVHAEVHLQQQIILTLNARIKALEAAAGKRAE